MWKVVSLRNFQIEALFLLQDASLSQNDICFQTSQELFSPFIHKWSFKVFADAMELICPKPNHEM